MARELRITGGLSYSQSGGTFSLSSTKNVDVTEVGYVDEVYDIGSADQTINLGNLSGPGYLFFENLDALSYVEFGSQADVYSIKVSAEKQSGPVEWAGSSLHAKATSGNALVRIASTPPAD